MVVSFACGLGLLLVFCVGEFASGCRQGLQLASKVLPCDHLPLKMPHTHR